MQGTRPKRTNGKPAVQARSIETRRRILEATIRTLIDDGYHACTTTEIVRRAGVARGAYSHHFGSQPELISAALHYLGEQRLEALERALARVRGGDRLTQFIELLFTQVYSGDLFEALVELWVAARTTAFLRPIVSDVGLEFRERVMTLFEAELGIGGDQELRRQLECIIDPMIGTSFTSMLRGRTYLRQHTRFWRDLLAQLIREHVLPATTAPPAQK